MLRLRHLLAWLLLAALPVQGFAASTVPQCGPVQRAAVHLQLAGQARGHEVLAHHQGHDGQRSQEGRQGQPPGDHAAADRHGVLAGHTSLADKGHGCAACAAACHAVGLAGVTVELALAPAPMVPASDPFLRFDSRPPPLPDKPPRA